MNVYTCTDHVGHYPVGTASVIVAEDMVQAAELLEAELKRCGLKPAGFTLRLVKMDTPRAIILRDGDY